MCSARVVTGHLKAAVAFFRRRGQGRAAKPSEHHQRQVAAFAKASGYKVVAEFSETMSTVAAFPSGRGFTALLRHIEATGVSTIIVASASEFATDPIVRAVGYAALRGRRIELLAADDPRGFLHDALPVQVVAQVLSLSVTFEKLLARAYHEAAHDRANIEVGPKHRKRYADVVPEVVEMGKDLHQLSSPHPLSFREISARLAEAGHINKAGRPYHAEEIRRMIKGPRPRARSS